MTQSTAAVAVAAACASFVLSLPARVCADEPDRITASVHRKIPHVEGEAKIDGVTEQVTLRRGAGVPGMRREDARATASAPGSAPVAARDACGSR